MENIWDFFHPVRHLTAWSRSSGNIFLNRTLGERRFVYHAGCVCPPGWGGSIFPQALMKLGLIDEYRINFHPVVLGSGKPLFTDIKSRIPLSILSTNTFESGTVGLCY